MSRTPPHIDLGIRRTFHSFDGEPLYYHTIGQGPPIVLLNGFVCTTHYWPPVIAYLKQFLTVVSWDYRGHGENQRPTNLETSTIPGAARDLKALLDHAGFSQAILMGHSMGAQVMFTFAQLYPGAVKGLISVCGSCESPLFDRKGRPTFQKHLMARIARRVTPYPRLLSALFKPLLKTRLTMELTYRMGANRELVERRYIDELYQHVTQMDFAVSVRFFTSMVHHSARASLSSIKAPTLLIGGTLDALVPPQTIRAQQQLIPGAETRIYDQGSHLAMLEKFDEAMADIHMFLVRHQLLNREPQRP